jgi:hypothetical protein
MPMYFPQQQQRLGPGGPKPLSLAEKRIVKTKQPTEPPKPAPLLDIEALEKQGKEVRIKRVHYVKRKDLDELQEPEIPNVLDELFPKEVLAKQSLNNVYSQQPPPPPLPTPPLHTPFIIPETHNFSNFNPSSLPPSYIPPHYDYHDSSHYRNVPQHYYHPPPPPPPLPIPPPPPPAQYYQPSPYYHPTQTQQPNYIYDDSMGRASMVPYYNHHQPRISRVNLCFQI